MKKIFENKNNSINPDGKIDYKKSLGQNFLYDTNLLNAIASDGGVDSTDTVLEIGAGAGTLTRVLANRARKVISYEIDKSLIPTLENIAQECKNVEFHFQDFMESDIDLIIHDRAKVVANIPYYITTPIIFKLVEHIDKFDSILVLIQKEVAERFASSVGGKVYGITSVILQSIFDVSITRIVRKECFTPSPKVDSALCKLIPHKRYNFADFEGFKNFVHLAFSMRRKTLVNNLKSAFEKEKIISALNNLKYKELTRPEEISVENFINLYNMLNN